MGDNDLSANKYSNDDFESDDNSNNGVVSENTKIEINKQTE